MPALGPALAITVSDTYSSLVPEAGAKRMPFAIVLRMVVSCTCRALPERKEMPLLLVLRMSMVRPRSETIAVAGTWTVMPELLRGVLMTASTPWATMLIALVMVTGPKLPEDRTLIAP